MAMRLYLTIVMSSKTDIKYMRVLPKPIFNPFEYSQVPNRVTYNKIQPGYNFLRLNKLSSKIVMSSKSNLNPWEYFQRLSKTIIIVLIYYILSLVQYSIGNNLIVIEYWWWCGRKLENPRGKTHHWPTVSSRCAQKINHVVDFINTEVVKWFVPCLDLEKILNAGNSPLLLGRNLLIQ